MTRMQKRSSLKINYSSTQVASRIGMRLTLLVIFAAFGQQPLHALSVTLVLSAIFCVVFALLRRELILGTILTNWDEAAIYLLIAISAMWLA